MIVADHAPADLEDHGAQAADQRLESRLIALGDVQLQELAIGQPGSIAHEDDAAQLLEHRLELGCRQTSPSLACARKVYLILPGGWQIYTLFSEFGPGRVGRGNCDGVDAFNGLSRRAQSLDQRRRRSLRNGWPPPGW